VGGGRGQDIEEHCWGKRCGRRGQEGGNVGDCPLPIFSNHGSQTIILGGGNDPSMMTMMN